jgi:hypothetical protein
MSTSKYKMLFPSRNDIVKVIKKSRGKFFGPTAPVGELYCVMSTWTGSFGTLKLSLINSDAEEFYTTASATEIVIRGPNLSIEWQQVIDRWRENTFVPVILMASPSYSGKIAYSDKSDSFLMSDICQKHKFWLSKRHCHPVDWQTLIDSAIAGRAYTIRIPAWFARKNKLFE